MHHLHRPDAADPQWDDPAAGALLACTPARGPSRQPVTTVVVDTDLVWVTPVPVLAAGAARPASAVTLVHLSVCLAQELAAANGDALDAAFTATDLVDAAARAVAGYLDDLPDLPLVGEPFGGDEGTD